MNKAMLIIILLCVCHPAWADDTSGSTEKEAGKPVTQTEPEREEKVSEPVVWPVPFSPSQEIGADSMISFPTDI